VARVLGVAADERHRYFRGGDGRGADVDPEHSREPLVLARALVNHVLAEGAVTREIRVGPDVEVGLGEHRPHGERLESIARVRLDEERVVHPRTTIRDFRYGPYSLPPRAGGRTT